MSTTIFKYLNVFCESRFEIFGQISGSGFGFEIFGRISAAKSEFEIFERKHHARFKFEIFGRKTGSDSKIEIFERIAGSGFEIEIFQRDVNVNFKFEIFERSSKPGFKFEIFERRYEPGFKFEIFQRASAPRYLLTVRFSFRTNTRSMSSGKQPPVLWLLLRTSLPEVRAVNASVLPVICRRFAADRDRMTVRRRTASQKGTEACKRTICRTAGRNAHSARSDRTEAYLYIGRLSTQVRRTSTEAPNKARLPVCLVLHATCRLYSI